jgi:hypothetical protein
LLLYRIQKRRVELEYHKNQGKSFWVILYLKKWNFCGAFIHIFDSLWYSNQQHSSLYLILLKQPTIPFKSWLLVAVNNKPFFRY